VHIWVPPLRPIGYFLVAAVVVGFGIDAGSVVLTRLSTPDDVREAGQAAAEAVKGMPVDRQAATMAFAAAADEGRTYELRILPRDFRLFPDGRVELTAARTAPTLLLAHISALKDLTSVESSATVTALPFS
jgi:hypothetical protein